MNTQARLIVGVVGAIAVALGVTLGIVIAMDDDDDMMSGSGSHMDGGDHFQGMMGAMGSMDSDDMLGHMRNVLGEDRYERMLDHMADHRDGGPMTDDAGMDQMMHQMMDGMMQHMPADANNLMPPGRDEHHETPTP